MLNSGFPFLYTTNVGAITCSRKYSTKFFASLLASGMSMNIVFGETRTRSSSRIVTAVSTVSAKRGPIFVNARSNFSCYTVSFDILSSFINNSRTIRLINPFFQKFLSISRKIFSVEFCEIINGNLINIENIWPLLLVISRNIIQSVEDNSISCGFQLEHFLVLWCHLFDGDATSYSISDMFQGFLGNFLIRIRGRGIPFFAMKSPTLA